MAHGDAGRRSEGETGEWTGYPIPFTLPRNMCTQHYYRWCANLAASSRLDWSPCRFKWTRPFRRKTKSGFCSCAIAFQLAITTKYALVQNTRGNTFVADATDQNCYTKLYGIIPKEVHFRSIVMNFFFDNYSIKHFHIKNVLHIRQATQNMFRHWHYTLLCSCILHN